MTISKTLIILISLAFAACGDSASDDTTSSPDGTVKQTDGKGDAWDWRNDPKRFQEELNYKWQELPKSGKSKKVAWADTYWPTYENSINARWQGNTVLSPVEKWDKAFNGWTEPAGFMDLKPFDTDTCEWDAEYYKALGPAATWVSLHKGNYKSRNGIDDDGDGIADKDECGYGKETDLDGVETWWGICHAWVPASILENEPQRAVTRNGVTFETSDIKALMIMQYDKNNALMLGGRCNEADVNRDDNGRLTQEQCRDVNAGSFHVIMTNFLGINSRAIAEDRTYNYEVWNQPVVGYQITEQKELSLEEVNQKLRLDKPNENGTPESQEEKDAVLKAANELNSSQLVEDAKLRKDVALAIVNARKGENLTDPKDDITFQNVEELKDVKGVGLRTLARLLSAAREKGWAPKLEPAIYSFNKDAKKFVEIVMTVDYISESEASKIPTTDIIKKHTNHDWYNYILEIDENDEIIGGEWVGGSLQDHPDFLWLPISPRSGAPDIDLEIIRDMVRESRDEKAKKVEFGKTEVLSIPDNGVDGVSSTVEVSDDGEVSGLKIDLKIEHSYRGDLLVLLRKKGSQAQIIYDGKKEASRPWLDDLEIIGKEIPEFNGTNIDGTWTLTVYDTGKGDVGKIMEWSVSANVK